MNTNLSTKKLIAVFLSEKDVAKTTIQVYGYSLHIFFKWLVIKGISPKDVTTGHLLEYKRDLKARDRKASTVDLYTQVLKSFFSWLKQKGIMNRNIAEPLKREAQTRTFKRGVLSIDQTKKLIQSIERQTIRGKRDYCLVLLVYSNGLRCCEVSRITYQDIDFETATIMIQGKGYHDKMAVSVSNEVIKAVEDYTQERVDQGESITQTTRLFVSLNRNPEYTSKELNPSAVGRAIIRRMIKSEVKRPQITAHSLRHSAAVHLISQGETLYLVQTFLRHHSAQVTEMYTRYSQSKLLTDKKPQNQLTNLVMNPTTKD